MPLNARRIIILAFLLTTIAFSTMAAYTTHLYFRAYTCVRNLNVDIQKFNVNIFNVSYASTETILTIQNPSECTFKVLYIVERLELEGQFISVDGRYMWTNPMKIPPQSNVTVTLELNIHHDRIQYVKTRLKDYWLMEIRMLLNGLLVGDFMYDSWFTTKITNI